MSFEIKTIEVFDRQAKRLAKHYVSFKQDYKDFLDELRKNPLIGTDLSRCHCSGRTRADSSLVNLRQIRAEYYYR